MRERIERLETRQATDDASLLILNRYWNQVNMFTPHVKSVTNSEDLQCNAFLGSFIQFDENVKLIIRRYDQANSEPEKSLLSEGRSLKPETPEPDGDSNQERAKDRGKDSDHLNWQMISLDLISCHKSPNVCPVMIMVRPTGRDGKLLLSDTC